MSPCNYNRNNKYVTHISQIKPSKRKYITIATITCVVSLWYFFIHTTIENKISKSEQLLQKTITNKELLKQHEEKYHKTKKKIEHLKTDLQGYCPENKTDYTQKTMSDILSEAKNSGIQIKSCTAIETTKNANRVSYEFTGDLDKTLEFCKRLKETNKALSCQEACLLVEDQKKCQLKCVLQFFA